MTIEQMTIVAVLHWTFTAYNDERFQIMIGTVE